MENQRYYLKEDYENGELFLPKGTVLIKSESSQPQEMERYIYALDPSKSVFETNNFKYIFLRSNQLDTQRQ